jgi:hypothetical protein
MFIRRRQEKDKQNYGGPGPWGHKNVYDKD